MPVPHHTGAFGSSLLNPFKLDTRDHGLCGKPLYSADAP